MTLTPLPDRTHRFRLPMLLGVCFLGFICMLPGCKKPAPPKAKTANSANQSNNQTVNPETEQVDADCDSYIDNSISMLEPDRLGISSFLERAMDLLNQWTFKCGNFDTKPPVMTDSQKPFFKKYLGEAQLAKMDLTRFTDLDGRFIRDAQLFNRMMQAAIKGQSNDVERATASFYYCMDNISLITNEKNVLPLSPFEICIFGAGSAEQRAWIYINVLRQLHIDAVLFRPETPSPFKLLVGVLLGQKVYLFDPVLGLPVPAAEQPADAVLVKNPATLDSVLKTPDLLKNFYGEDAKNRFSAEELKAAQVLIMGRSCEWSARMRRLEDSLSRKQTFVLFRNLDEFEGDPGFIAHIQSIGAGILKDAPIKVSEYPDQQITESKAVSGEKAQIITNLKLPFSAPVPFDIKELVEKPDGTFEAKWGSPSRKLLKTRIKQLMGDQEAAIQSYVSTRLEKKFPAGLIVPQQTRLMHLMAARQAAYYLALGQVLQGEYASASKSLNDYLRQQPNYYYELRQVLQGNAPSASASLNDYVLLLSRVDQERAFASVYLLAISDAKAGKLSSAIFAVSETKIPDALKPAFPYLEKRWRAIRDQSKK